MDEIHTNIFYIVLVGPDLSKQILHLFRKGFRWFNVGEVLFSNIIFITTALTNLSSIAQSFSQRSVVLCNDLIDSDRLSGAGPGR